MKKGLHPQMQWISYVTQSGRLMHVMMTRIHHVGKVYHFGAKRQMAQSIGQIAKFKRRFNEQEAEAAEENNNPKKAYISCDLSHTLHFLKNPIPKKF